MASTIIFNGNIYVERENFAQAVYIENGIIKAVGTNEEIMPMAQQDTQMYDAQGRTVVPGFNDSHQHLLMVGELLESIQLLGVSSIREVQEKVRQFISDKNLPKGTVVHGMGWNQDYFTDESRILTKEDLDAISTEYPIILERACGHILTANTAAMNAAGITAETQSVEGGAIDKDENGNLTGVFRENACGQILCIRPEKTVERVANTLRLAMTHASECGITSVQTMDLRPADWEITMQAYNLVQKENPSVRIYHQCNFMNRNDYQNFLDKGYRTGTGDSFNKIGPLKIFVDGSLGARTAVMRKPYNDQPDTQGITTLSYEDFTDLLSMAKENSCQVVTHAIGDGAIEFVLNGYDSICENGENPLRLGVVHCQITDIPLVERFCKNDILALVQPIFLHYDMTVVEDRVGKELASTSYAFETMRKLGIHTSFGTDSPVEDMNAIDNIYCAVTRKNLNGSPEGGFYPNERMDIYSAIDAYTQESAYVSFEENVKGRIKPGYYADMVVLSENIFTINPDNIRDVKIDATMVDGRFVYQR